MNKEQEKLLNKLSKEFIKKGYEIVRNGNDTFISIGGRNKYIFFTKNDINNFIKMVIELNAKINNAKDFIKIFAEMKKLARTNFTNRNYSKMLSLFIKEDLLFSIELINNVPYLVHHKEVLKVVNGTRTWEIMKENAILNNNTKLAEILDKMINLN